ncbi:MAG: DUF1688 family protein [Burkholderiales bacterium]|nr:DUF1688 family protein [Burkholderiales bacterium]
MPTRRTSLEWVSHVMDGHPAAPYLCASAIRRHAAPLTDRARQGQSELFAWRDDKLHDTAAYVAQIIKQNHPDLRVPYHARWRHFEAGGVDRWAHTARQFGLAASDGQHDAQRLHRARVRVELAIISVLLDAGAGAMWRYLDHETSQILSRSEGLAVASLRLYESGQLSSDPRQALRADARALIALQADDLARAFQVSATNPLVGLDARVHLINRLGKVVHNNPAIFASADEPDQHRLGNLVDTLIRLAPTGRIAAADILALLLRTLGPVWPSRMSIRGVNLGDCWPHPYAPGGLIPFHKLTQWLTYSLLEPLEEAGLIITDLDALTGLPEYRNGGLLLDSGLIAPLQPGFFESTWRPESQAVVEWRALTVIGLDLLANAIRAQLHVDAAAFPLARVLEGGTWSAGRQLAASKREGGGPPFRIELDGTIF